MLQNSELFRTEEASGEKDKRFPGSTSAGPVAHKDLIWDGHDLDEREPPHTDGSTTSKRSELAGKTQPFQKDNSPGRKEGRK